jgi:hypothetical protein
MCKFLTGYLSWSQVIDLSSVSPELAYLANDADLVVLEGMVSGLATFTSVCLHRAKSPSLFNSFLLQGRAIETNLYAQMKCDSIKIGMVCCISLRFYNLY